MTKPPKGLLAPPPLESTARHTHSTDCEHYTKVVLPTPNYEFQALPLKAVQAQVCGLPAGVIVKAKKRQREEIEAADMRLDKIE